MQVDIIVKGWSSERVFSCEPESLYWVSPTPQMNRLMDTTLDQRLLDWLKRVDTPTVCNAIEVAQGQRGFAAFTRGTMLCSRPDSPAIVGFARTASIAAAEPPSEPVEVIRRRRLDYFKHMARGDGPRVAVVEDVDTPDCIGAWWGEVHTAVHKGLGLSGAVTNGVMRDLADHEPGFPVVAGSIGPSHGFVHVRELGKPVTVFGLTIEDGDLIHADQHGALVIPVDTWPALADAIETLLASEKLILEPARQDGFDIEALQIAWKAFEQSRT